MVIETGYYIGFCWLYIFFSGYLTVYYYLTSSFVFTVCINVAGVNTYSQKL